MNVFTLYWLDGKTEQVRGETIAEAFNKAGYGNGAMAALDYYSWNGTMIKCRDCGKEFLFTKEQQLWFEEKGFQFPKRCPDCKKLLKFAERNGIR